MQPRARIAQDRVTEVLQASSSSQEASDGLFYRGRSRCSLTAFVFVSFLRSCVFQ